MNYYALPNLSESLDHLYQPLPTYPIPFDTDVKNGEIRELLPIALKHKFRSMYKENQLSFPILLCSDFKIIVMLQESCDNNPPLNVFRKVPASFSFKKTRTLRSGLISPFIVPDSSSAVSLFSSKTFNSSYCFTLT